MLSRDVMSDISRETVDLARDIPSNVYGTLAGDDAERAYRGEELEDDLPLADQYDPDVLVEKIVAICEDGGEVSVMSPYDIMEGDFGDEGYLCYEDGAFEKPGMCELPFGLDHCNGKNFLGSIHTHPSYPPDPSPGDFEVADNQESEAFCIAARGEDGRRIGNCWFPDEPGELPFQIVRDRDMESRFCTFFKYYVNPEYGYDEAQACDDFFIDGWQLEVIRKMRELIDGGEWRGTFCHAKELRDGRVNLYCEGDESFWRSYEGDERVGGSD